MFQGEGEDSQSQVSKVRNFCYRVKESSAKLHLTPADIEHLLKNMTVVQLNQMRERLVLCKFHGKKANNVADFMELSDEEYLEVCKDLCESATAAWLETLDAED